MELSIVVLVILFLILAILSHIAIKREKDIFNDGKCHNCGSTLTHFDTDSQGGRGYCCYVCGGNYIWISWNCVDQEFLKNERSHK